MTSYNYNHKAPKKCLHITMSHELYYSIVSMFAVNSIGQRWRHLVNIHHNYFRYLTEGILCATQFNSTGADGLHITGRTNPLWRWYKYQFLLKTALELPHCCRRDSDNWILSFMLNLVKVIFFIRKSSKRHEQYPRKTYCRENRCVLFWSKKSPSKISKEFLKHPVYVKFETFNVLFNNNIVKLTVQFFLALTGRSFISCGHEGNIQVVGSNLIYYYYYYYYYYYIYYYCYCCYYYTYSMVQQPLKSFDLPLLRVSLSNSI